MPTFEYKAYSEHGEEIVDVMEGSNPGDVAEKLQKLGYLPIEIRSQKNISNFQIRLTGNKIKQNEIIVFTKQLVTLLKAGVPLLSCLEALNEQASNEQMKEVIQALFVDIESGASFSEALAKHPKVFSNIYVNSIKAGEMGGALDDVLERLAQLMEHEEETSSRVKSAMRYPLIVVVALIIAMITLMMLVVPKFKNMFEKLGVELPLPTRMLLGSYSLLANYWYVILAFLALATFAFYKYIQTEKGAYQWDNFKITAPIFGPLNLKTAMSRFTRMFETLNKSGLPILQTLDIAAKTVGNRVVGKEIEKAAIGIMQGEGLAAPLSKGKIFPPLVVKMIAIGEQSGALDDMMVNVSRHYDTEVDYAVKNLTSMIEPVLTVGVGVIVLFLALAIFLPMWDLTKLAQ
ncbi:MAG: type II secretion system F family protein [bacterium]